MIPSTLLGLLVFAASIGPGYVYVSIAERRQPRTSRSGLLEVAELITVGGLTSTVALLLWLLVAEASDWVDLAGVSKGATAYAVTHPGRTLTFLFVVLATSYSFAWQGARFAYRHRAAVIAPGSVWSHVLSDDDHRRFVYATAELRDGRSVFGQVESFTLDEDREMRQISLGPPIKVRTGDEPWKTLADQDRLVVKDSDVMLLSVDYQL